MTPVARVIATRQFSLIRTLRAVGRSMEAHPYERLSTKQKPAPGNWSALAKRYTTQVAIFFPTFGVLLGWPWAIAPLVDGHI